MPTTSEFLRERAADQAFAQRVAEMRAGAVPMPEVTVNQIAGATATAGAPAEDATSSVVIDANTGDVYSKTGEGG